MLRSPAIWKIVAEIEEKEGSMTPRIFYVAAPDEEGALKSLKGHHPSCSLLGQPEAATADEIDATGGAFRADEPLRCVRL